MREKEVEAKGAGYSCFFTFPPTASTAAPPLPQGVSPTGLEVEVEGGKSKRKKGLPLGEQKHLVVVFQDLGGCSVWTLMQNSSSRENTGRQCLLLLATCSAGFHI